MSVCAPDTAHPHFPYPPPTASRIIIHQSCPWPRSPLHDAWHCFSSPAACNTTFSASASGRRNRPL